MPEKVALPGSERTELPGATLLGPVPEDERLSASIVVRQRPDGPGRAADLARAGRSSQPGLSDEQYAAIYRADDADVQAVADFARSNGFTVDSASALKRTVRISGTARQFRDVFGTSLQRYRYEGQTFRGRTGPVLAPAELAEVIDGVFGIDNRPISRRLMAEGSSGSAPLTALQVAAAYNFPAGVDGTGQTIAIVEFGGGYLSLDLIKYFNGLGLATPIVIPIGANSPGINAAFDLEVTADIEIAGGVAPGANIVVYFAPDSGDGWQAVLQEILNDTVNNPSIISISWGIGTSEDSAALTEALRTVLDSFFASAAAKRVTVLAASGDSGSSCGVADGLAHVVYPASSPEVTGCGGSVLSLPPVQGEVTWNNPGAAGGFASKTTGGGVSDKYPVPLWQANAGVPASANPGAPLGRGVPDVCGHADAYQVFQGGAAGTFWGTSAVAPLWAGLVALINQQLGRRTGALKSYIYQPSVSATFHDVTDGSNGAYDAGHGWDACTGLGSPDGSLLAAALNALIPPVVTGVTPASGSTAGETAVTITGLGFTGVTDVGFGAANAAAMTVDSGTQITTTSPAGSGTVDVTVTTPGGTSAASPADQFTYIPRPVVTAVDPGSGLAVGGTNVTITGTGFAGVSDVGFGPADAMITSMSDTQLTATSPGGTGTVAVIVNTPGGPSAATPASSFTYIPQPMVTGLEPGRGPAAGGTTVTITGTGFASAIKRFAGITRVGFGAADAAAMTVDSDTQITATSPAGAGTVDVTVTTPGGASGATPASRFTYIPRPVVTGIAPASGPATGGTTVTITGTEFGDATNVRFGAANAAALTVDSDTQVTVTSPAGSGTVAVTVNTPGGPSAVTSAAEFTYIPVVTGVTPGSGPATGGTSVTIAGTGLAAAIDVNFGAANAATTSLSDTQVTATSPGGSGTVDITVTTPGGTSAATPASQFAYIPVVTGVTPGSGPATGGTSVTIAGAGLAGASNIGFGPANAVITSVSETQVTATSPGGSGTVDITVTTPGGTSAATPASQFTYIPRPVVTGVDPASGPASGGTAVTITGTSFAGATDVGFGAADAADMTVDSETQITATSPSGYGTVAVTVTTLGGTSTAGPANQFAYTPVVAGVDPASGPEAGGTSVTITGAGFVGATDVGFGGAAAADMTVDSDSEITATSPSGSGTVNVTVTTPGGTSAATPASQFTYIPRPVVTSVDPATGPATGGTSVTITGTDLAGATDVGFGPAGARITAMSDTELTATSPGGFGTVDVTVTTLGGTSDADPASQFAYIPVVTGVDPGRGPETGGTRVTITGAGFSGATDVGFGAAGAADMTVDSDSEITATSPGGSGTVDVTVTTPGGSSVADTASRFTYTPRPVVTGVDPASGPAAGGTRVTITGADFADATDVGFGPASAMIIALSDSEISATSPGGSGTVDVTVTTPGGTSDADAASQFTYIPRPEVTGVDPGNGPEAGGTRVTITGADFADASDVGFGDTSAEAMTVDSEAQITATSPSGYGTVTVTVITPGGTSFVNSASQFTYDTPYDDVPYDDVPYDDVPYDDVPYDDSGSNEQG